MPFYSLLKRYIIQNSLLGMHLVIFYLFKLFPASVTTHSIYILKENQTIATWQKVIILWITNRTTLHGYIITLDYLNQIVKVFGINFHHRVVYLLRIYKKKFTTLQSQCHFRLLQFLSVQPIIWVIIGVGFPKFYHHKGL